MMFYVPIPEAPQFVAWAKVIMEINYLCDDITFNVDIDVFESCWGGKKIKL